MSLFSSLFRRRIYPSRTIFLQLQFCRNARSALSKPIKSSFKPIGGDTEGIGANAWKLLRGAGFCVMVSGVTYVGCAVWNYESVRNKVRLSSLLTGFDRRVLPWRDEISRIWTNMSDGKKLIAGIIAANCAVLLLWQLKSVQIFMRRFFLADPQAKRLGVPLFLSMFSHSAPFHLFCNMYVLWSFSDATLHMFGKEQFLFFYISAGLFSGLLSTLNKYARGIRQPSLGASGAIIAALAAVCTAFPESKLSIIFLPMYPFSADHALKFLIALEAMGVILKWRYFDHAAHLAGILFGIWYVKYGHRWTWGQRKPVVEAWHKVRGGVEPKK